jgi:perosamine synthetase
MRQIPIARPWMDEREAEAARKVILSGWVTQGPEVEAFEREFAAWVGARHACAVSNGTAALHLALLAAGVGPGDEVITVSHSFIATANSVRYCGALPVFVDIDPATLNLDPGLIEEALTPRTRAILCVDQIGMPCDLRAIGAIARAHGLRVVEDAACAIGSEIRWDDRWERIGRPHAAIACFSLHPRKLLSTGDGGMLATNDPECDRQFRLWRQHGMTLSDLHRHRAGAVTFESYDAVGYNYRLTDIQAAVGRVQLARLPEALARRRELARRYRELLAADPELVLQEEPSWARSNWQSFYVRLPRRCDQRQVMQALLEVGVSTRRGVMCAHREPAYADVKPPRPLRHSEEAQDRGILLPLFPQMSDDDQDHVARALLQACGVRSS